jgi:hypothetical protein
MAKNYVTLKLRVDAHEILSNAVKEGLEGGFYRYFKYTDYPCAEEKREEFEQMFEKIQEQQHEYVMNAIYELLYYEEEDE